MRHNPPRTAYLKYVCALNRPLSLWLMPPLVKKVIRPAGRAPDSGKAMAALLGACIHTPLWRAQRICHAPAPTCAGVDVVLVVDGREVFGKLGALCSRCPRGRGLGGPLAGLLKRGVPCSLQAGGNRSKGARACHEAVRAPMGNVAP